jgi:hypothetical protein
MSICRSMARSEELMSGAVADERLHLAQGAAEDAGDMAGLVLLGQLDGQLEVVLHDGLRELRRELGRRLRAALDLDQLGHGDRQRVDRHDGQDDDDAPGEGSGLVPQCEH